MSEKLYGHDTDQLFRTLQRLKKTAEANNNVELVKKLEEIERMVNTLSQEPGSSPS